MHLFDVFVDSPFQLDSHASLQIFATRWIHKNEPIAVVEGVVKEWLAAPNGGRLFVSLSVAHSQLPQLFARLWSLGAQKFRLNSRSLRVHLPLVITTLTKLPVP
jgi:hypothetical protein